MNVGKLYQINKWYWVVYPSMPDSFLENYARPVASERAVADFIHTIEYWNNDLKSKLCYIEPNSNIVILLQEQKYCKVLAANGKIGWIVVLNDYLDCFEEVT